MGIVFLSGIDIGRGAIVNDKRRETEDWKKFWSRSSVSGRRSY
jgi:hypothetical protein